MKNKKLRQVLFVRRAFQMTAVSVVLVMVISIAIVVAGGTQGDTGSDYICGKVKNIEIEETATELIVHWEPPYNPENGVPICARFYHIDYSINGVDADTVTFHLYTNYTITKGSCAHHWIGIRSSELTGAPAALAEVEVVSGIVGNGAVQNLAEYNGNVVWNRPELSETCTLTYTVHMAHEFGESTHTTEDLSYPLPTIPCLENTVTVTANVLENGKDGDSRYITHTVPASSVAPVHGSTNPTHVGAVVRWERSPELNACKFLKIVFELLHDDDTTTHEEPFDPDTGEVTADFIGFLPEDAVNDVTYTARWILENGVEGVRSEAVRFLTEPLTNPIVTETEIIQGDDGGILISWRQDYDQYFITEHVVSIKSFGPEHILSHDCPTDAGTTHSFSTTNLEVSSYLFTDTRPHFKYNIIVTTYFGRLGDMRRESNSAIVVTPTGVPGAAILEERHEYQASSAYDVTSFLSWSIPCDINGPLRQFNYRLTGRLLTDVQNTCDFELDSGQKTSEDPSLTSFVIETNKLNPFFEYTLVVETIIDVVGGSNGQAETMSSSATLTIQDLPAVYTPPES